MAIQFESSSGRVSLIAGEPRRDDDADCYLAALEMISERDEPFVLLVSISVPIDLPQEQKKAQNLWFKRTRERMNELCRACAIVRLEPTKEMQRTFQGLWSFPVRVTGSLAEAEAFLAGHTVRGSAS